MAIEFYGTVESRSIGESEAFHPEFPCAFQEVVRCRESGEEGVVRMDVEMRESHNLFLDNKKTTEKQWQKRKWRKIFHKCFSHHPARASDFAEKLYLNLV